MFQQRDHEDSDQSECTALCEQEFQLREQEYFKFARIQRMQRSADACLSLARIAFKLCDQDTCIKN